jgi:protein O-GlcNAc transferase
VPSLADMIDQSRRALASGQAARGVEIARRAAAAFPREGLAQRHLADVLSVTGAPEQAAFFYERAVGLLPGSAPLRSNYGWLLVRTGQAARGVVQLEEAVRLDPSFIGAHQNLVLAYQDAGDAMRAVEFAREAVVKFPGDELLARNAALAFIGAGLVDEAEDALRRVGSLGSVPLRRVLAYLLNFSDRSTPEAVFEAHRGLGAAMMAGGPASVPAHAHDRNPDRPLRVAYLSQAFCNHSAGHFLLPIIESHDAPLIHVSCYSRTRDDDELTARFRAASQGWCDATSMTDAQLADRLRADRIDIAVDTTGQTSDSMLGALLSRPAPVQMTYLGYPNTTGLPVIDYRIVDSTTDPAGYERLSTERLIRLDPCFLCYSPPPHAGPVAERAVGAPLTFGSFNTNAKLSPSTIKTWAGVLRAVPGSRLLLKNGSFSQPAVAALRVRQFEGLGIDPARIEIMPGTSTKREHLEAYARVDVAIDSFPYNGTTTTVEALWMGVPVVCLAGRSHVSRVGMSLLTTLGLGDLVADDAEGYIRIAAAVAGDAARRTELRATLRSRISGSALMDGAGFTRRLESAYRQAWREWCAATR